MAKLPLWRSLAGSIGGYLARQAAIPAFDPIPGTIQPPLPPQGQPVEVDDATKAVLTRQIATPSVSGVRPVITGYPTEGLTPDRLARILRAADQGDPLRYFELAEQIEERDHHYLAVLGTRKRSVAQIEPQVEQADDSPLQKEMADRVRDWLSRDTLQAEVFDIMDAVGKGISFNEVTWDVSSGQWEPARLDWRDPRWFRFDYIDGRTPLLRTQVGAEPLTPGKFIVAEMQAKSGLPIRSGIARVAVWSWMFKAYTTRDWQVFLQAYGQPIRVGKYDTSSSDEDRTVLMRAVSNIAGDCAAIIPNSMEIEFIEASVTGSTDAYERRCDWLDQQVSKAVLGQTATTDAINGGHAVGKEHREVQKDITIADGKLLSAILNRQLIRPWMDMEFGPQPKYPKIKFELPDTRDLTATAQALQILVPQGLQVLQSEVRDILGFTEPPPGAPVLTAPASSSPSPPTMSDPSSLQEASLQIALQRAQSAPDKDAIDAAVAEILAGQGWEPMVAPMIAGLSDKLQHAGSLDEVETILATHLATMDVTVLASTLARAAFSARASGSANETLS
jgi:phage gp29-like protein